MFPFLRSHLPIAALVLGFGAGEPRAIIVYVAFPSLTLIEGAGPEGGAEGVTALVSVSESGPYVAFKDLPMRSGETLAPVAGVMAEFDIRHLDSYVVPITFDVFDWGAPPGADIVDVDPGPGGLFTTWYDLETGAYAYAGPLEGNGPGPRAILDYRITSDPFRYEYSLMDYVWQDPEGLWHYEYGIANHFYSTFDLEALTIPGLGTRQVDLEIWNGTEYLYEPIISDRPPISAVATLEWGDLRRTRFEVPIQVPSLEAMPEAVPEPGTVVLLASGLAVLAFAGRRRAVRRD
jgi:hypothetical protein